MRTFDVELGGQHVKVCVAETVGDYWDARSWLEAAQPETVIGLDVETTGTDPWDEAFAVRMVQVSDGQTAWLLRCDTGQGSEVRQLLRDHRRWATHTQFDAVAVNVGLGIDLGQTVVDTYLLAKLIAPEEDRDQGLKPLTALWLNAPELEQAADQLHERFRAMAVAAGETRLARASRQIIGWGFSNIDLSDPAFERYAALDAVAVAHLAPALVQPMHSLRRLVGMEMWLATLMSQMRVRGMAVDTEWVTRELEAANRELAAAEETICRITGLTSARSPKRVEWLQAHGVKFDADARTPGGKPSLSKDYLPPLVEAYKDTPEVGEVLLAIHALSERSNLVGNLTGFLNHADANDRVHPEVHTLRARTSRMSVTNPAMQTLSKTDPRLRGCFRADEGMVLLSADFAQVEARVAAALSGDPVLAEPILAGTDLHADTAARIWGPDFTPEQRQIAKIVNFGSIYGGGAKTLAKQAGITVAEAADIVKMWRSTYRVLTEFSHDLSRRKTVVTPTGRVLPVDPERPYAALNYMVQSTSRDLLVLAVKQLIEVHGIPARALWMLVHDEVVLQVPAELADELVQVVADGMHTSLYGIPIKAEANVLGVRWGK